MVNKLGSVGIITEASLTGEFEGRSCSSCMDIIRELVPCIWDSNEQRSLNEKLTEVGTCAGNIARVKVEGHCRKLV